MIKVVLVIPYAEMTDLARQVFAEHTAFMRAQMQDQTEYALDILVASTTSDLPAQTPDCDVMIVRGGTYLDLCQQSCPVPLVELIINGADIVNMILSARQLYGSKPIAILGTQNMVLGVEKLAQQLGADVTPYLLRENTRKEIVENVDRAYADGKQVIIGGFTGCKRAKELGLASMLIASGRDALWTAISEAKQLAKISRVEREKALSLQTLLDNAYEGLLAVDRNNRISFLNAAAIRILQLSAREDYLGKKSSEVLFSPAFNHILSSPQEYMDEIIEYKNTHLSVKKVNLFMHGLPAGSVITMLNASQIQWTEDKLRSTLHRKGHTAKYTFDHVITRSPRMQECLKEAKAYALTDSNVMLVGESGTGKELISQSIHNWSRRAKNNFVAINCAALPENLLESELFGYTEGAFTGAAKGGKPGLFEIAHNGTIFLDEISEIPLSLQGRLLRVLQEREIMRLGDSKIIPIDIRVIAATNRNLEELVKAGKFRRDLYYRLYVLQLNLPSLRERKEDIPPLVESFLQKFQSKAESPVQITLSPSDYQRLQALPWYGNIRELRNFCERLAVLYQPGTSVSQLISHLLDTSSASSATAPPESPVSRPHARKAARLDPQAVQETLARCSGNKTLAAQELGISRVTLWRLLKEYESLS